MSGSDTLPPYVNKGPGLVAVAWVLASLGLLALGARLYTRARIVRKFGWDDWTIIIAAILAVVVSVIVTIEVHYGVGKHAAYIPPQDLINAVKWIWLAAPFSTFSACFGKTSIALLILRIINHNKDIIKHSRAYTIFLWTLIVLLFIFHLLMNVITFAQCTPVTWLWDQQNPAATEKGTCWDPNINRNYGYFKGAFAASSDLVLALFPILIFKDFKIELKLKMALCGVMGLGIIATAAAAAKTVQLQNLATPDFTYNAVELVYWFMTENWVIIIAACIPTLAPLYFIATGQRSVESYAAAFGGENSDGSESTDGGENTGEGGVLSWGRKLLGRWRWKSPTVRSADGSGETSESTMEKGMLEEGLVSQTSCNVPGAEEVRLEGLGNMAMGNRWEVNDHGSRIVNGFDLPLRFPSTRR